MKDFYRKYPLVNINDDSIRQAAYFKWKDRVRNNVFGNAFLDWKNAEDEYFAQALKYIKNIHHSSGSCRGAVSRNI